MAKWEGRTMTLKLSDSFSVAALALLLAAVVDGPAYCGEELARAGSGAKAQAKGPNQCNQASRKAVLSCRYAARADYWLALAKCEDLADPAERKTCKRDALLVLKEALALCSEQLKARLEVCGELGGAPYDPVIDPANFVPVVDNPFFPLVPGTTFIYEGPTDVGFEHDEVTVTDRTRTILGVPCVEVHD